MIPKILYRGDADKKGVRDLRSTLHLYQLQTNLLKAGTGHEIFTTPIVDLVARHVDPGWAKSHFLSFSEDKVTALRFGLDCTNEEVNKELENFTEYYQQGADWSFALITIDTSFINWKKIGAGIYHGTYEPSLLKFANYPGVAKVILINVVKAIKENNQHLGHPHVLSNAVRDKEWLVLPATEIAMNNKMVEYSGIVDGKCISEIMKYQRNQ
jgi:hypothetical protein